MIVSKANIERVSKHFNCGEATSKQLITRFNDQVAKLSEKDIFKYSSIKELTNAIDNAQSENDKKREAKKGAKLVYENFHCKIYLIETKEAATIYGKKTVWCITPEDHAESHFYRYIGQYISSICKYFFILDKGTNKKYAVVTDKDGSLKQTVCEDNEEFSYKDLRYYFSIDDTSLDREAQKPYSKYARDIAFNDMYSMLDIYNDEVLNFLLLHDGEFFTKRQTKKILKKIVDEYGLKNFLDNVSAKTNVRAKFDQILIKYGLKEVNSNEKKVSDANVEKSRRIYNEIHNSNSDLELSLVFNRHHQYFADLNINDVKLRLLREGLDKSVDLSRNYKRDDMVKQLYRNHTLEDLIDSIFSSDFEANFDLNDYLFFMNRLINYCKEFNINSWPTIETCILDVKEASSPNEIKDVEKLILRYIINVKPYHASRLYNSLTPAQKIVCLPVRHHFRTILGFVNYKRTV